MDKQKYNNYPLAISQILGLIEANDIAIPEIQRPFVWRRSQVRDLMDSLYKGYPTGYIIIWKNPSVKLKNGSLSEGKKVLIDGQQRITALMTAIAGKTIPCDGACFFRRARCDWHDGKQADDHHKDKQYADRFFDF